MQNLSKTGSYSEIVNLNFYLKKLNIGRFLATYVALLNVEIWDPFRGGPQLDIDLCQCRGKMGCVY